MLDFNCTEASSLESDDSVYKNLLFCQDVKIIADITHDLCTAVQYFRLYFRALHVVKVS